MLLGRSTVVGWWWISKRWLKIYPPCQARRLVNSFIPSNCFSLSSCFRNTACRCTVANRVSTHRKLPCLALKKRTLGRLFIYSHMSKDVKQETTPTKKTNRLAKEKSPYLLQHADNPVDWYPWGEEAFRKAKEENKPIFLSVGYSTCHWYANVLVQ